MQALILYWSLTGCTHRVAERIAEGIRAGGVPCDLHDLREGLPDLPPSDGIVGVGSPVHWYRVPAPVAEAVARMAPLEGRSVFAFTTNGTYRGAGLNRLRRGLARAGGVEIGAFACHGQGDFYPYARLGAQFSPDHPDEAELAAASAFGGDVVDRHRARMRGERPGDLRPKDPPAHPMYALERSAAGPRMTRLLYSRLFRVDDALCTRCGLCARSCPTGNIAWSRGETPRWGRDCMLCLRCRTVCPAEAVSCPLDWPVFTPFVAWNVRRAWRDPALDHARVEFAKGRTRRL